MADGKRPENPETARSLTNLIPQVEPLHDDAGEEHPRALLQQMYEQSGEARRRQ